MPDERIYFIVPHEYLVIGFCVIFYVALDGFGLGVGIMNFFTKKDQERRIFLNSIGPVWDGNEVWLVIVGGALFAGFTVRVRDPFFRIWQPLHDFFWQASSFAPSPSNFEASESLKNGV